MQVSIKWLQRYIDMKSMSLTQIATSLTAAGFEVEGISQALPQVHLIIGKIVSIRLHPNADHLHICKVDIKDKIIQIICGAPNVAANQKVIVALPNAIIKGVSIKETTIRGELSEGMITSLQELGVDKEQLSEESLQGIEILDNSAVIGDKKPLSFLGYDDEYLQLSLTPNRKDCLAYFSLALECGAIFKKPVDIPKSEALFEKGSAPSISVISHTNKSDLFLAKKIHHIKVKPSERWMRDLLHAAGMKSINNVVDISNIVMLETGQPLHFYDLDKVSGKTMSVKDNCEMSFEALDLQTYDISKGDVMIFNDDRAIGIAGIMGGEDSKICEGSKGILVEAAHFNARSIRNSARRLNINSEASIRYQKGIEPMACLKAMNRAIQLLIEYADASQFEKGVQFGNLQEDQHEIRINLKRVFRLLGMQCEEKEVINILTALHLQPVKEKDDILVTIPSYREDLNVEEDIIEEIMRLIGYDSLPATLPATKNSIGKLDRRQKSRRSIRQFLTMQGYQEFITYSLISQKEVADPILSDHKNITMAMPLSEDHKFMRTNLLPSVLKSVAYNQARTIKDIACFEISNIYYEQQMEERLCICTSGNLHATRWRHFEIKNDFYTMKGLCESLLEHIGFSLKRVRCKSNTIDIEHFHPYQSAVLYVDNKMIGIFGKLHPLMEARYNVKDVYALECKYEELQHLVPNKIQDQPFSKFPSITRDIAFIVDENKICEDMIQAILKHGVLEKENIIKNVEIFDIYKGENIDANKQSIALSITFQSHHKTLKDENINTLYAAIVHTLEKDFQACLRS